MRLVMTQPDKPPDGIKTKDGGIGNDGTDDSTRAGRVCADFPPQVDGDAGALYEQ